MLKTLIIRIDFDKGKDLYDMYFNFVSVRGVKLKSKSKGVYDQLQKMFTKHMQHVHQFVKNLISIYLY